MKIYSQINDETADFVKQIALTKGLEKLNYNKHHSLYKVGSKAANGDIEMQEKVFVAKGSIELLGTDKFVCLFISDLSGWFRTSPINSCKKNKSSFIIETANSFYELKEDK